MNEVIAYIDNSQSNDAAKASAQPNSRSDQSEPAPERLRGTKRRERIAAGSDAGRAKPDGEDQKRPAARKLRIRVDKRDKRNKRRSGDPRLSAGAEGSGRATTENVRRDLAAARDVKPQIAERPEENLQLLRPQKDAQISPRAAERREEIVPMSQLRRKIAERLVQAQQTAALLTTFNEIDMTSVIELRHRHRDAFAESIKPSLDSCPFRQGSGRRSQTGARGQRRDSRREHCLSQFFDIGIAVGGGRGLVVPVLRDVEPLGFAEIETAIADFARRAEQNKLKPDELQGGTFTISNGGIYGSLLSTPIVNPRKARFSVCTPSRNGRSFEPAPWLFDR